MSQDCALVINSYSSEKRVTCWPATQTLETRQCPLGQQLTLFNQNCDLVESNSSYLLRTVTRWPADHTLQLGNQQLILFRQDSAWWTATHPLQSGPCPGGEQLILFRQDIDLLYSYSSASDRTVTCWPATHPLHSGQFPGGQQPILFNHDPLLVDRISSSSFRNVLWCPAEPRQ
jgi:hypothetical protein